jgi:polyisoprenyl-phosphate glycosyltransferase
MTTPPPSRDGRCDISIVVPLLNEVEVLPDFVSRIRAVLEEAALSHELVLVDDGSSDGTWEGITAAGRADPRVRGISLSRNFGKDAAIFAGLSEAVGDAVMVMDGDLQHPPEILLQLVAAWRAGADVVEGVKRSRPDQPLRVRTGARLFNRLFTRLTSVDLADATDLRLLSRAAADALLSLPEHAVFFRGTSTWIGFDHVQIAFDVEPRPHGATRFNLRSLIRFAIRSLTSFTSAPLHLVTLAGFAFAGFSLVLGTQTLVSWARGDAVEGFTTVILLLLIQGSVVLLGLGIIGEYLARIHDEVKGRPRYIVARRTDRRGTDE